MFRFTIALLVAGLTATAHAQLPTTAQARAKELKERITITTFRLELLYHGHEDKPFYRLILSVPPIKDEHSDPFCRMAQVSEEQAGKIIDRLATDGFLTNAVDLRPKQKPLPPPTEPSYTLKVGIYYENLGWGLPMLNRLDGLRKVLDSDAATETDFLLVRLSGFRKLWEKEAIAQIADHSEAIRLNPRDARAYYNRGWVYGNKGEYDKAIADYTEAIRLNPKYAKAYCDRGVIYGIKNEWDMAIADYTEAIRVDPKFAPAYFNRGGAYGQVGDRAKADADFAQAKKLGFKEQ